MNYKEVKEDIEKAVNKHVEENQDKLFRYKIAWNDTLSLVWNDFDKFGFKNILKSSINLYSKYFNELSTKLEEAEPEEAHNSLEELANEFRSIRINGEAEPIRMKIDYCKNIYSWALNCAREKGINSDLFLNIFQESFDRWDVLYPSIKTWKGKPVKNFKLSLEENLN